MSALHNHYIGLVDIYLGERENMRASLAYMHGTPEIVDIHIGELNAALSRLERYRGAATMRYPGLLLNTEHLLRSLDTEDLPLWREIEHELASGTLEHISTDLHSTFEELKTFKFIDQETCSLRLLGTLFLAFYRTYTLVTRPSLRSKGVQVASTLEEMLALLAFDECHTQLFEAVKHWILDFENEGFSEELAQKVAALPRKKQITDAAY